MTAKERLWHVAAVGTVPEGSSWHNGWINLKIWLVHTGVVGSLHLRPRGLPCLPVNPYCATLINWSQLPRVRVCLTACVDAFCRIQVAPRMLCRRLRYTYHIAAWFWFGRYHCVFAALLGCMCPHGDHHSGSGPRGPPEEPDGTSNSPGAPVVHLLNKVVGSTAVSWMPTVCTYRPEAHF